MFLVANLQKVGNIKLQMFADFSFKMLTIFKQIWPQLVDVDLTYFNQFLDLNVLEHFENSNIIFNQRVSFCFTCRLADK